MIDPIKKSAADKMDKSISAFQSEINKIRTGRAHPSLISHLSVDYYGTLTPVNQVAAIAVEDARTLSITPWEKNMVSPIEKAILSSDLGLNPATQGTVIRVPMPPLTEERRKDLIKKVKQEAETARVAVRNIRRDAKNQIKDLLKNKEITEDEERNSEDMLQKLTDKYIKEVDHILSKKEEELMEI